MLSLWLSALVTTASAQDAPPAEDAAPPAEEEASADDTEAEDAPADEAPAEDAPAEEAPAEDAPAEEGESATDVAADTEAEVADMEGAVEEASAAAEAEEAEDESKLQHLLTVGLGATYTTGNTEVVNANADAKYVMKAPKDTFTAHFGTNVSFSRADVDGDGTVADQDFDSDGDGTADSRAPLDLGAQRVFGTLQYDRTFGSIHGLYVKVGGEHDFPAGLLYRFNQGVGYSLAAVSTDTTTVKFEAGIEFVEENLKAVGQDDGTTLNDGNPDTIFVAGRLFLGVTHAFNEYVSISNDLELLENLANLNAPATPDDFRLYDTFAVSAKVSDMFSLKVSNRLAFDNRPTTPEFSKIDNTVSLAVVATIL